jgi:hypothetical protein
MMNEVGRLVQEGCIAAVDDIHTKREGKRKPSVQIAIN